MQQPAFALPPVPARPRRVLLFVAMRGEAAPIARALGAEGDNARMAAGGTHPAPGAGNGTDVEIDIATPGADPELGVDRIGPVHAASSLARLLMRRRYDLVVNMGTAGGFESQGGRIADLVVVSETMFHDARVALPGLDAVARAHTRLSPSDAALARAAARIDARVGVCSTGSSLDATADETVLFARTAALAKDMELAALAVVCRTESVALAALKGVTDLVDHHEPTEAAFLRNFHATSARVAAAAQPFIQSLLAGDRP